MCQCPRMFACTPAQNVKLLKECEPILSKTNCLWHSSQHCRGALIQARHTMSRTLNTFFSSQEIFLQSLIHPKILLVYYETQLFNWRMSYFFYLFLEAYFSASDRYCYSIHKICLLRLGKYFQKFWNLRNSLRYV